jgi:type IV pilus assembly protein PilA
LPSAGKAGRDSAPTFGKTLIANNAEFSLLALSGFLFYDGALFRSAALKLSNPMLSQERGFTVIELLIVLAVLAVLVALAYPRYEAYTTRSKVAAVLKLADKDSRQLSHYYAKHGSMPQNKAAAQQAGVKLTNPAASQHVQNVQYQHEPAKNDKADAQLTYTLNHISDNVNHKTIHLTSEIQNNQVQWHCTSSQIDSEYLPSRCHSKAK